MGKRLGNGVRKALHALKAVLDRLQGLAMNNRLSKWGRKAMHALNTAVNAYVLARLAWSLIGEPVRAAWRWLLGRAD
jgi:hypothetical protein